jgi:hypothetical protein
MIYFLVTDLLGSTYWVSPNFGLISSADDYTIAYSLSANGTAAEV